MITSKDNKVKKIAQNVVQYNKVVTQNETMFVSAVTTPTTTPTRPADARLQAMYATSHALGAKYIAPKWNAPIPVKVVR